MNLDQERRGKRKINPLYSIEARNLQLTFPIQGHILEKYYSR